MTEDDVRSIVAEPAARGTDRKGNARYGGDFRGCRVRVVVAGDDPGYVIAVHLRGKLP